MSSHLNLLLSSLADNVNKLCGVKLSVSAGYAIPPNPVSSTDGKLAYEGRSATISLSTNPSASCQINPPPLVLGDQCYSQFSCNASAVVAGTYTCPGNGHLDLDYLTKSYCLCSLPCANAWQTCNCGITSAMLAQPDQCSTNLPSVSGCYCTNTTTITRFADFFTTCSSAY